MERLDATAGRALGVLLDGQPLSGAKVRFAWAIAAGPALARAASVTFADGTLYLTAKSEAWRQELLRARPVMTRKLGELLGPQAVRTLVILDAGGERPPMQARR
jgi:Dna[CI] antecedent, DciA